LSAAAPSAGTRQRQQLRRNARQEAERWGWAGATEQLRGYYREVLSAERQPALMG